ncbi:MAG: ribosome biogenesis/translation initiation ATPase RLI [Methanosphaera sp.]|uniref:ribosome biogenesis/translation initiation ATPase RLI n=1 Tax=Methanosphaera sp. TaxID=2666342 RepID=UPI0025FEF614|nr:ribosome biogenesis/translation initiation ATPase RLI [Methanosphaera sp.]MCI5866526.1 ribosome biogenesis/translation initiation ATPase RLI [Methanosphaera sp.]MDD6535000.1 ribosome biogenesis/translation initiation ATPase RLI [Methanosphaera sp.]MDY3955433.1 ribosome biogenesis/translation initiation ATPase RLI [Methanosphaera sp.]
MSRIAILDKSKCQPKKCNYMCIEYCPGVRMEEDTIVISEDKKPVISEELCQGCGICVNRCVFNAINIINLPEQLDEEPIHRYGQNSFELFGMPKIEESSVVGLLGPNGIGKSTILNILSGQIIPNFGRYDEEATWDNVIEHFKGSQLQSYFKKLSNGDVKLAYKPQMVDLLPKVTQGNVKTLLEGVDQRNKYDEVVEKLELTNIVDREIKNLSGGELQRIAIAAAVLKDADFYYIDEPTSWLDVKQRLNTIEVIRDLTEEKRSVLVIEHDLATVDAMSDYVHVMYGQEGGYGVVSNLKGVRVGINAYVKGFLAEENIRIRDQPIKFEIRPPNQLVESEIITEYTDFSKEFKNFNLEVEGGEIPESQVITAFGPNGIGKTTYAKLLAGIEKPDNGEIKEKIDIGYKPQYIQTDFDGTVEDFLYMNAKGYTTNLFRTDILKPFDLDKILDKQVSKLSGGELQRLATAVTLSEDADVYLLDEPTAFLDVEQRLKVAKAIKHIVTRDDKAAIIIDHDIVFIDYVSDRAMVFYGQSGVEGKATAPIHLRDAMNKFLSDVKITFRRDKETNRPRVNKYDSFLDREQKQKGEYYYLEEEQ